MNIKVENIWLLPLSEKDIQLKEKESRTYKNKEIKTIFSQGQGYIITGTSGIYNRVQMRHVRTVHLACLYRHSTGRPVLRYYCTVTKWSDCIIYPAE